MREQIWDDAAATSFWEQNEAPFAGDTKAKEVVRLARSYIRGRILDVGAGSGTLVSLLPNAVGVDIAPKSPNLVRASVTQLPFLNHSFRTVFATDVLEHLQGMTLHLGMTEIWRVLDHGGHFIITVPNRENLEASVVFCPKCGTSFHRWGHVNTFGKKSIFDLLTNAGFSGILMREVPLGLMAQNGMVRRFWRLLMRMGMVQASDLFVVARKI